MSENEIKPVAWISDDGRPFKTEAEARRNSWNGATALYDQQAIDRLTAELRHYQMAATAEANLADERHKEIKRLRAERDAAVADAASLRERMLALEAQRDEFGSREWQAEKSRRKAVAAVNIAYRHLDVESLRISHCKDLAAIDAARAEGGV